MTYYLDRKIEHSLQHSSRVNAILNIAIKVGEDDEKRGQGELSTTNFLFGGRKDVFPQAARVCVVLSFLGTGLLIIGCSDYWQRLLVAAGDGSAGPLAGVPATEGQGPELRPMDCRSGCGVHSPLLHAHLHHAILPLARAESTGSAIWVGGEVQEAQGRKLIIMGEQDWIGGWGGQGG